MAGEVRKGRAKTRESKSKSRGQARTEKIGSSSDLTGTVKPEANFHLNPTNSPAGASPDVSPTPSLLTPAPQAGPPSDPWANFWPRALRESVTTRKGKTAEAFGGRLPHVESLGMLLKTKLPPRIPRISPWLSSGESCLLWGGTGTGKSMVGMTLALAVAGGGKVFGWDFPNPCKVLYVDGEQDKRTLQTRFELLAPTIDGHDSALAAKNLGYSARTAHLTGGKFFDIACEEHAVPIVNTLRDFGAGFVIFDNLSTLADSLGDENSAVDFKKMQALFARLKGENIASILLHHAGKNKAADTYRGSSNIATTFERVVGLVHDDKEDPRKLAVTVKVDKFRDKAPEGFHPEFPLELTEEKTAEGTRAVWKTGELHELREGWRMYAFGEYRTNGEFVNAYNKKFGRTRTAGNFATQFSQPWSLRLGVQERDIRAAARRMEERRKGGLLSSTGEGTGDF